jgi:hypothetical protein
VCAGIDSTPDQKLPAKGSAFVEIFSLVLYAVISCRIYWLKRSENKVNAAGGTSGKSFTLSKLEKETIGDLVSNFFIVFLLAAYIFVMIKLRDMDHLEFNFYPNYLYIYFHQVSTSLKFFSSI